MHSTPTTQKGFSLVELLVSVALFTIVITMAVGTLLVLIDANAKAQNMQEVMTNVTFALDSMTREIRTGRSFYCSAGDPGSVPGEFEVQDCTSGGSYVSVVEGGESLTGSGNPRVAYRFNGPEGTIERKLGDGSWFPITSSDVTITDAAFYATDTETGSDGNAIQSNVTVYIEGHAGELASVDTTFEIQASIARRILDI